MNKVVAFLEKYAEWLAMTVATLFLLYMVYANVVDRKDFLATVPGAPGPLAPGEVDKHINQNAVANLVRAMKAPSETKFPAPNATADFARAMGANRLGMITAAEVAKLT